jgi:hypothetical protein
VRRGVTQILDPGQVDAFIAALRTDRDHATVEAMT